MVRLIERVVHSVVSHPFTYDLVQCAAGAQQVRQRLSPYLAGSGGSTVLDIGAGTGGIQPWLPKDAKYIWLDSDPHKLLGFRSREPAARAVLADASGLCFANKSIDYSLCIAVLHHLSLDEVDFMFREISRVTRKHLVLLDPLDCPSRLVSRALWSIDRGSFARTPKAIQELIGAHFDIERTEIFSVLHRYIVCVGKPRVS